MKWLPLSGCGTQHPHRALGGTRVLLAAAPTTPPCFRRWRRSSSLHSSHFQRKNYFKFRDSGTPAGVPLSHFHERECNGKRQLPRWFPAETSARRGALSVIAARCHLPRKGEVSLYYRQMAKSSSFGGAGCECSEQAERVRFQLNCKVCGFAKGSPFGRAGIEQREMTERARTLAGLQKALPEMIRPPLPRSGTSFCA